MGARDRDGPGCAHEAARPRGRHGHDRAYTDQDPGRLAAVEIGGVRTFVIVPMLKDGELIGAMSLYRRDIRAYTEKQIKLVSTFADQAVIAIENVRLFEEVQRTYARSEGVADNSRLRPPTCSR